KRIEPYCGVSAWKKTAYPLLGHGNLLHLISISYSIHNFGFRDTDKDKKIKKPCMSRPNSYLFPFGAFLAYLAFEFKSGRFANAAKKHFIFKRVNQIDPHLARKR